VNGEKDWEEWEVPREADGGWSEKAQQLHAEWWEARIARQKEIDASIAAKAEFEYLYDKPYVDNRKVRVRESGPGYSARQTFPEMILENLKTAGVHQAHREDRIEFTAMTPWPGYYVCAEGTYVQNGEERIVKSESGGGEAADPHTSPVTSHSSEKRAGIFIGPEFGTVTRPDLVDAAREAADAGFDVLIACAFNYEAHATEFSKMGRIPVLKARMNAVFDPSTGEVRSDGAEGIACWFIDTDYNGESFFVRHAYFLGANDPYSALKTTLKAEINEEAWATLHSDTSRPFEKPESGRIAVKVINHLGDEVMKVFRV